MMAARSTRPLREAGAGRLRRRMTLERLALVPDGAGGDERIYEHVALLWASLTPNELRADKGAEGAQRSPVTHRLVVRWRPDLDASSRFRLGRRVFDVQAVADADERRRWLVCLVEEATP